MELFVKPFKSEMTKLFSSSFKFKWDLLHLVNRAHIYAAPKTFKDNSVEKTMDYIDNHSKEWRTGLDYTNMIIQNIVGFKRPKLKSDTRMVVYDFDVAYRFLQNSSYFDIPYPILVSARIYVLVSHVTRIILKIVQSTDVKSSYVDKIFIW